jgi:NAD+ synthase (glutamine-hydrolysing)
VHHSTFLSPCRKCDRCLAISASISRTFCATSNARKAQGAKIIIFPELSTSGYLLSDRWEDDGFIKEIEEANEQIRLASVGIIVVWGSVKADREKIGEDGRVRKYNAVFIAQDGFWVPNLYLHGWVPKTNLPKYRMFDDARHFYPAAKLAAELGVELEDMLRPFLVTVDTVMVLLALFVCEDIWEDEYNTKISQIYAKHKADFGIDVSHSPWTFEKWHARDGMLKRRAKDIGCPILYVNSVGLQNNAKNFVWFDGNSALINKQGEFVWRAPQNEAGLYLVNPAKAHGPVRETHARDRRDLQRADRRAS